MTKKTITYKQAVDELERILEKMQREDIAIDTLEKDVQRAAELLNFCHEKLRTTEENVSKLLEDDFNA